MSTLQKGKLIIPSQYSKSPQLHELRKKISSKRTENPELNPHGLSKLKRNVSKPRSISRSPKAEPIFPLYIENLKLIPT